MTRPLLWIAIAYVCGIVLGRYVSPGDTILAGITGMGLLLLFLFLYPQYRAAILVIFASLALGCLAWNYNIASSPGWIREWCGERVTVEGTIVAEPLQLGEETRYRVAVEKAALVYKRGGRDVASGGTLEVRVRVPSSGKNQSYLYGERLILTGRLVAPSGLRNPGGFNYLEFLRARGLDGLLFVQQKDIESHGTGAVNPVQSFALNLRQRLLEGINNALPPDHASLLSGILFGQRQHLPEGIEANFRAAGVSHLLVVSGLHVGLVAAAVTGLLLLCGVPSPYTYLLTLGFVIFYAVITGLQPATLRASVMIGIGLGGMALSRRTDWPTMIAAAAIATLLYRPLLLFTVSFQLSYIATLSILFLSPFLEDRFSFIPEAVRKVFSVTVAAQLGIIPITAYYFHQVSVVSLLTNLLIFPFISLIVGIGLAAAVTGFLFPVACSMLNLANLPLLTGLLLITRFFGNLPLAYVKISPPKPWFFILYYLTLFLLGGGAKPIKQWFENIARARVKRVEPVLLGLLAVVLVFIWAGSPLFCPKSLEVTFLDVGQGDAIYIKTPYQQDILIDGGGQPSYLGEIEEVGERVVVPFLRHKGVKELDLVIVSHPHEDHFGGIKPVLEHFPVGMLITGPELGEEGEEYRRLLHLAKEKGIPHHVMVEGDTLVFGPGLEGRVVNPPAKIYRSTGSDLNNNSLVLHLSFQEHSFLFTGDIEREAVLRLIEDGLLVKCSVLKVPHHGGFLEPLPRFLEHVDPRVAVISVGHNSFGHPHPATVEALEERGVVLLRTDKHGAVTVTTDGSRLMISSIIPDANHYSGLNSLISK